MSASTDAMDEFDRVAELEAEIEQLRNDKAELLKKRNADEMQKMIDYWGHRAEKAEARIARLEAAVEQALDDMGEKGLSVCQQAKEMLQAALAGKEGTNDNR